MNHHWKTFACAADANIAGHTFAISTLMTTSPAMIARNDAAERGTLCCAARTGGAVFTREGSGWVTRKLGS